MIYAEIRHRLRAGFFIKLLSIVVASSILAVSAQIALPLPFSPVPVTMQTAALFFISLWLGPQAACVAVGLYLVEGACGLPVFSMGRSGLEAFLGPRAGYLLGFLPAVIVSGCIGNHKGTFWRLVVAFTAATGVVYFFGALWLAFWIPYDQLLTVGVIPFLLGDAYKIGAVAAFFRAFHLLRSR